jgi:hypothetical protein
MISLGVILLIIGLLVTNLSFLVWLGVILIVIGIIVNLVPIGGTRRRVY